MNPPEQQRAFFPNSGAATMHPLLHSGHLSCRPPFGFSTNQPTQGIFPASGVRQCQSRSPAARLPFDCSRSHRHLWPGTKLAADTASVSSLPVMSTCSASVLDFMLDRGRRTCCAPAPGPAAISHCHTSSTVRPPPLPHRLTSVRAVWSLLRRGRPSVKVSFFFFFQTTRDTKPPSTRYVRTSLSLSGEETGYSDSTN